MKESILNPLLLFLVLAPAPWMARAQPSANPPGRLSYQGYLTDTNGLPLATNAPRNYTLNFRIYSAPTGTNVIWGEQQTVTVDRGSFAVRLGNGIAIAGAPFTNNLTGVFAGTNASARYLGVTVTDVRTNEVAPRLRLLASPYALLARSATALLSPDGSNLVTAANGQLTVNGTIAGNGSGLTNLATGSVSGTVAQARFPTIVLTNGASGVTLTGTIGGDGGGLMNIPASAVVGVTPPGMVLIPAGSFTMGNFIINGIAITNDTDITDASPTNVYVSTFYMDKNLVTWSQWQSVYYWATNHGYSFVNAGAGKAANHPVLLVNWYDCVKWCNARSEQAGLTPVYYTDATLTSIYRSGQIAITNGWVKWVANGYRLPTEAEFEKAARGGVVNQRFPWGNLISENLANYAGNPPSTYPYDLGPVGTNSLGLVGGTPATTPGGTFGANGYGLNDMAGNVFQWCWDWYGTPYAGGSDPHGLASGADRVVRGGSWWYGANNERCANRIHFAPSSVTSWETGAPPHLGFRCVRGL